MRLLLVSCSATKRLECGPAIEVYDGTVYRWLRSNTYDFEVRILSTKYGILHPTNIIESYDLTTGGWFPRTADKSSVPFDPLKLGGPYNEAFIYAGKTHREVIDSWDIQIAERIIWSVDRFRRDRAYNGILSQQARLKVWAGF